MSEDEERTAIVYGAYDYDDLRRVRQYLPANYTADLRVVIRGHDVAGWTMDEYVIPRLASGLIWAKEVK